MPTKPSDLAGWASAPSDPSDVVEPPTPTKLSGWLAGFKPPHSWFNWWMRTVGRWVDYLDRTIGFYSDLTTAVDYADANLTTGDMLTVYEDDSATGPGVELIEGASGAAASGFGGVDACGDLVVFSVGNFDMPAVNRELVGSDFVLSPIATYTRTNSGVNYAIKTDGAVTVQAYGNYLEAFNAVTGASLWVFDNTVPVADVCMVAGAVYIVSAITTGAGDATANRHMHKLVLATGAVTWSLQHSPAGDELRSVCTNGRQVFVSGTASGYASGATTRAIVAADGFDATGECNNGADLSGLAWNRVDATVHSSGRVMDCDGSMIYQGNISSATYQLEFFGQADGVAAVQIAHPDAAASALHVSCDQDYVYMCTSDGGSPSEGYLEAYDKRTGALAWRWASTGGAAAHTACVAAVSDGSKVFALGDSESNIWQVSRGNVPARFRVIDPSTELVRYRNWKLQPEAQ